MYDPDDRSSGTSSKCIAHLLLSAASFPRVDSLLELGIISHTSNSPVTTCLEIASLAIMIRVPGGVRRKPGS